MRTPRRAHASTCRAGGLPPTACAQPPPHRPNSCAHHLVCSPPVLASSAARTGVSLRNLVGVPCLEPPNGTQASVPASPSICAILVLYTRIELPQSEAYNMLLHALGSAAAAAYALGLSKPKPSDFVPAPNYTSVPTDGPATSLSWLLLAAARALQVDIAEHWTARKALPNGSGAAGVAMIAEQLLVSQRVHNLPDTVLATGERAEQLHPFSSHMSRATLYAGKLVWCNGTSASGALEGVKLPVQTAVGLPLRSHVGGGAAFVLYSMRRLEQSTSVTYFIAQLQVLAAASHAASSQTAMKREQGPVTTNGEHAASSSYGYANQPGPGPSSAAAPSSSVDVSDHQSNGALPADMWVTPEAVMSTEQVLSLIDCLGPDMAGPAKAPSAAERAAERAAELAGLPPPLPLDQSSRMSSGIPLAGLLDIPDAPRDTPDPAEEGAQAAPDASALDPGTLDASALGSSDLSAALCV